MNSISRKKLQLSAKQQAIFDFIKQHLKDHGYPPAVREIGQAVGLRSSATVHNHLCKLQELGLIKRDPTKPRAIEIMDEQTIIKDTSFTLVPLVGKITAGTPILATQDVDDVYPLPTKLVGYDTFMLHVQGDSMMNASILDGDYVLVRPQTTANNGEIVAAMLKNDEATVKRFFKENNHFRLQPENDYYQPIITNDLVILGVVIGVIRLF